MGFLAEDLITSIKLRSFIPISQGTYNADLILQAASEELRTKMVPMLIAAREDIFLTYKRVALVAGKSRYPTPERAIGGALKDIYYIDASGSRTRTLTKTKVHDILNFSDVTGEPREFIMRGDELVCYPTPDQSAGYLEFWYFSRPNEIVATSNCAKITAVSTLSGTTTLTVDTDLSTLLSVGGLSDFISSKSPFLLWSEDVAVTAITASTISVATADISDEAGTVEPQVGDYVCVARESNIPMLPEEFHPILAQMTAVRLLQSMGDMQKSEAAKAELQELVANGFKLISNRVESEIEVVSNRHSILSAIGGSW